jgi:hypothetical protein
MSASRGIATYSVEFIKSLQGMVDVFLNIRQNVNVVWLVKGMVNDKILDVSKWKITTKKMTKSAVEWSQTHWIW